MFILPQRVSWRFRWKSVSPMPFTPLSLNECTLVDQDSLDIRAMLKSRSLLRGDITYDTAKERDANILHELGYRDQMIRFFTYLYRNRELIKLFIISHLGLAPRQLHHPIDVGNWVHGSFNVCIRTDIVDSTEVVERQMIICFPLLYRIEDNPCSGNSDEKVRCEAGTYTWLKESCLTVPILRLHGFVFFCM